MQHIGRTFVLVAGALALGGSSLSAQAGGKVRKGEMPVPDSMSMPMPAPMPPSPLPPSSAPVPAPAPDSAPRTYESHGDVSHAPVIDPLVPFDVSGWNDAQIAWHLVATDSLEIALANLGLSRSRNAIVRDEATRLAAENRSSMVAQHDMSVKQQYGLAAPSSDPAVTHLMQTLSKLQTLSGAEFDRAWLDHQLMHLRFELDNSQLLADTADNDELTIFIEQRKPALATQIDRLNQAAGSLR